MLLLILGYEKNFHNGLSDYDNESLYVLIVPTLSEESAVFVIDDEDTVDLISKKYPTIRWKSWLCSWCCYLHLNLYRVLFIILMVEVMTYCALLSPLSPEREGEWSSSSHQSFQRRFNETSFFRGGLLWKRGWPVVWMDRSETVILSVKKPKKCYFC